MSTRKVAKREREASAEPMEPQQASEYQHVAETSRARIWEMHLRGIPKTRIAAEFSLARATVARVISACYAEVADEHKQQTARKLGEAVQRMRLVQEQAWNDHDADDERERQVLALSIAQAQASQQTADAPLDAADADWTQTGRRATPGGKPGRTHLDALDAKSRHNSSSNGSSVSIRYQSQRSQYLRIILDAEKEIARLEGLYEGLLDVEGAAVFLRITKISPEAASALSAANRRTLPAPAESSDGESAAS